VTRPLFLNSLRDCVTVGVITPPTFTGFCLCCRLTFRFTFRFIADISFVSIVCHTYNLPPFYLSLSLGSPLPSFSTLKVQKITAFWRFLHNFCAFLCLFVCTIGNRCYTPPKADKWNFIWRPSPAGILKEGHTYNLPPLYLSLPPCTRERGKGEHRTKTKIGSIVLFFVLEYGGLTT
jgi:hypothetical protein